MEGAHVMMLHDNETQCVYVELEIEGLYLIQTEIQALLHTTIFLITI